MVAMGALPGIKPGEAVRRTSAEAQGPGPTARIRPLDIQRHWKVVYIVGEACPDWLPPHDFLIYQNALPALSAFQPDLVLPSALFTESAGTMFNVEGKLMAVAKAVEPPGSAKPDWWIMSGIAVALGGCKMGYGEVSAVQAEIRKYLKSFPETKKRIAFTAFAWDEDHERKISRPAAHAGEANEEYPFLLYCKPELETYRGLPLAEAVPGMKRIGQRGYLLINTEDATKLGLEENGLVDVGSDGFCLPLPIRMSPAINAGIVHLVAEGHVPFTANPCPVRLRRNNE
jgi:anaerobic selenocysteine-containing dehydrogenase